MEVRHSGSTGIIKVITIPASPKHTREPVVLEKPKKEKK